LVIDSLINDYRVNITYPIRNVKALFEKTPHQPRGSRITTTELWGSLA